MQQSAPENVMVANIVLCTSLTAGNDIYYELFLTELIHGLLRATFNKVNSSLQIFHHPKMHLLVCQYQLLTFSRSLDYEVPFLLKSQGQQPSWSPRPWAAGTTLFPPGPRPCLYWRGRPCCLQFCPCLSPPLLLGLIEGKVHILVILSSQCFL